MGAVARRRSKVRKRRQGPGHNEANRRTRASKQRSRLLDGGREPHFRYEIEELLAAKGKEPEEVRPFLQALWTQGSRKSTDDATDFVQEKQEEGFLDDETSAQIERYIQKYSTWR